MNAPIRLADYESRRKELRYVFGRRGLMTVGAMTMPIRTLDVSAQGMGVMGPLSLKAREICPIALEVLLGARVVPLKFSCKVRHCILAGMTGFRSSLYIDNSVELHQRQLQKIIATCSTSIP